MATLRRRGQLLRGIGTHRKTLVALLSIQLIPAQPCRSTVCRRDPPTARNGGKRSIAERACRKNDRVCKCEDSLLQGLARGGARTHEHRDRPASAASRAGQVCHGIRECRGKLVQLWRPRLPAGRDVREFGHLLSQGLEVGCLRICILDRFFGKPVRRWIASHHFELLVDRDGKQCCGRAAPESIELIRARPASYDAFLCPAKVVRACVE